MHFCTRRLAILAAALPLAAAPASFGQQAGQAEWIQQSDVYESLLDIEFPGGRLDAYYAGLSRQLIEHELPFNVVVSPQARFIEMPAFNARAMTAVDAIRMPGMLLSGVEVTNTPGGVIDDGEQRIERRITFVVSVDMAGVYVADTPDARERVSIEFGGGTVAEYIAAVRRQAQGANIIVSERARDARVAAITLRDAPLAAAVQAIDRRLQGGSLHVTTDRIDGELVFAIDLAVPDEETAVWSLAEHLQAGMNADDLLSGVEAAVGAVGEGGAIRFHAPTAMLIVRGGPDQVSAADQAVSRMLEVGERSERSENDLRANLQAYEQRLVELQAEARIGAKRVEIAQMRVEEMREHVNNDVATEVQLAEAELEVIAADSELQQVLRSLDRIGEAIKRLEERLDD